MGQGPTFFFIFIVFVTPFMRYLYLVNKHQAWEHTSSRTTSWHWSSVILFQHNKRGWNGMIFFFLKGWQVEIEIWGWKKIEREREWKWAREQEMTESEAEVCFYWTVSGSYKCSLNFTGEKISHKDFFLVWEEKRREEASLPLYFRKLRQNVCYVMEISSSPAHVSPSTDLLP